LAGLVRQNFQGIPISAQGKSNESAVPALRRDYSHIFVNFGEVCKNFNFNLKTLLKL